MAEIDARVKAEGRTDGQMTPAEVEACEKADAAFAFHGEEMVRYGVRGHAGLEMEDGDPAPFTGAEETLDGRKIQVVSPHTMELYRANRLVPLLAPLVREVQTLPETARGK
jgi:hypothetical protein